MKGLRTERSQDGRPSQESKAHSLTFPECLTPWSPEAESLFLIVLANSFLSPATERARV